MSINLGNFNEPETMEPMSRVFLGRLFNEANGFSNPIDLNTRVVTGTRYSPEEDEFMRRMFADGFTQNLIAQKLGREPGSVSRRISVLGLARKLQVV